jgi:hypothetical protein
MAEKETQVKTNPETTDESKNTENKQELSIPKARFDEVNLKAKEAEKRAQELESKLAEIEKNTLKEKENFKELAEKLEAELKVERLTGLKRDLIQEAIISKELNPKLAKMVSGTSEEEIKASLEDAKAYHKELIDQYEKDHTASDNSGFGGKNTDNPMSKEEYARLLREDPSKADEYLRKMTEKELNG